MPCEDSGYLAAMRVGNWNLNHGGARGAKWPEQSVLLLRERLDIVVLTEPPPGVSLEGFDPVVSPTGSDGWSWVAILGPAAVSSVLDIPYSRMAAAASMTVANRDVVVYGSVLPWRSIGHQSQGILGDGELYGESFTRLLREQAADVAELQSTFPDAIVLWAGDFNQALAGTEYVGSKAQRVQLEQTLTDLGMRAWNSGCAHAMPGGLQMCAIDLVCGPSNIPAVPAVMKGSFDDHKLSDHPGYVVTLDVPSSSVRDQRR